MAFLFKRNSSPNWYIGYYDPSTGKRGVSKSTGTRNKIIADKKRREFENKIKSDIITGVSSKIDGRDMKFSEAFKLYISFKESTNKSYSPRTIANYNNSIKLLYKAVSDKAICKYNRQDYVSFVYSLNSRSQNYKSIIIKPIIAIFNWLVSEKYITENYFENIVEEKKHLKILTDNEIKKILELTKKSRYHDLVQFCLLSAFRIHEALKIKRKDILDDTILITGKGNKTEEIPIILEMRSFLELYFSKKQLTEEDNLFPFPYSSFCHYAWRQSKDTLGFKFVSHDFRKYSLTKMANSGVPINFVSKYARHSDIKTTLKYYIQTDLNKMRTEIDERVKIL